MGQRRRFGERTNEAWTDQAAGFYYVVVAAMLQVGFGESEIARISGETICDCSHKLPSDEH